MSKYQTVHQEALALFQRKNADYGDAFKTHGIVGILVRIGDKLQRFQHITTKGIQLVDDESLRDTLIDLHNYAAMGIMGLDDKTLQPPDHVQHQTTRPKDSI